LQSPSEPLRHTRQVNHFWGFKTEVLYHSLYVTFSMKSELMKRLVTAICQLSSSLKPRLAVPSGEHLVLVSNNQLMNRQ